MTSQWHPKSSKCQEPPMHPTTYYIYIYIHAIKSDSSKCQRIHFTKTLKKTNREVSWIWSLSPPSYQTHKRWNFLKYEVSALPFLPLFFIPWTSYNNQSTKQIKPNQFNLNYSPDHKTSQLIAQNKASNEQ